MCIRDSAEDDADRDDGVARGQQDDVSLADGVEDAWCRGRAFHADDEEALSRYGCPHSHPPLLEMDRAGAFALVDDDVGLHRSVGHRQQSDAAVGQAPAVGQAGGPLAERASLP